MASDQFSLGSTSWKLIKELLSGGLNVGLLSLVGILAVSQIEGVKSDVIESEKRSNSKIAVTETRLNEDVNELKKNVKAIASDVSDLKVVSGKLDAKLDLVIEQLKLRF